MKDNLITINKGKLLLSQWKKYDSPWYVGEKQIHSSDLYYYHVPTNFLDLEYSSYNLNRWHLRQRYMSHSISENNYLKELVKLLNFYLEDHFKLDLNYSDKRRLELYDIIDDYIVRLDSTMVFE